MTAIVRRPSRRLSVSAGIVLALLGGLVIPAGTSTAAHAADLAADGASLPAVRQDEAGMLSIDVVGASGVRHDAADTVIEVEPTGVVDAVLDSAGVSAGAVRLEWVAVDPPEPSTATGAPAVTVRSVPGADVLLGSTEGEPSAVDLAPLESRAVQWSFTGHGEFRVDLAVTSLDAAGEKTGPSATASLTFHVSVPADPDPLPEPEPDPDPGTEPPVVPQPPTAPVLPEGQSPRPAPTSSQKRVIGAVHTDMVSAFLDRGALVLDSKADIDADGDGVVDLGSRLSSTETLFHLDGSSRMTIPSSPVYSFLGAPGSDVWLAPQTQDPAIIWPGFSTEHPSLSGTVRDAKLSFTLQSVSGPGAVEVFLQGGTSSVIRTFSSTTVLPPWTTGVPQHTHMNWAFSAPGTYELTFQATGVVDGRSQTATNRYTMVVGDLRDHTVGSATALEVDRAVVDTGESLHFTAAVTPTGSAGAVQFRDRTSGVVLGHTPVRGGTASFVTSALTAGRHEIVAEFVPTWSNDVSPSMSRPVVVTVAGEVREKPTATDSVAPTATELSATRPGTEVLITTPGKRVGTSGVVGLRVLDPARAGEWVSVWAIGSRSVWLGWVQADLAGALTVDLPASVTAGSQRIALKDTVGSLVGWDALTVVAAPGDTAPGGGGSGGTPAQGDGVPAPVPAAPTQSCAPGVVLETGHVDAFFVSAANGTAVLQLMEDVTGHRVVREAESVLLRVRESAYRSSIPFGAPGTPSGYVLPLTQDAGLLWPGWDTNRTAASGYTDVTINITSVSGPGRVHLSTAGPFGDLRSLLTSGGHTLPGSIREPVPVHTHAQWVFSTKGIYTLTVNAVATDPKTGKSLRTAPHRYVFQVGDAPLGDTFCGLTSSSARDAALVNAAVDEAAAAAIAADQAAAEEAEQARAAAEESSTDERSTATTEGEASHVDAAVMTPWALIAILAGGALVILAIAGGTTIYLRRLRRSAAAYVPGREAT